MNMPAFTRPASTQTIVPDHEVIIIGAGISGIGVAIQLRADGIDDILILERSEDVGGTWRDNRYPGIAVDITSFTYSFSFEQNANWSRVFAGQRAAPLHAPGGEQVRYLSADSIWRGSHPCPLRRRQPPLGDRA